MSLKKGSRKKVEEKPNVLEKVLKLIAKMDRLLKLGLVFALLAVALAGIWQLTSPWIINIPLAQSLLATLVIIFSILGASAIGIVIAVYSGIWLSRYLGDEEGMLALGEYSAFKKFRIFMFLLGAFMIGYGLLVWNVANYYVIFTLLVFGSIYVAFSLMTLIVDYFVGG